MLVRSTEQCLVLLVLLLSCATTLNLPFFFFTWPIVNFDNTPVQRTFSRSFLVSLKFSEDIQHSDFDGQEKLLGLGLVDRGKLHRHGRFAAVFRDNSGLLPYTRSSSLSDIRNSNSSLFQSLCLALYSTQKQEAATKKPPRCSAGTQPQL